MIKGSCACGRVQYQTEAHPLAINACHCITCQRVSGAPYLGFVDVPTTTLQWTTRPEMWQASDIAERGYCKVCGSTLSMRYFFEADRTGVVLGSLIKTEPVLPPIGAHIFLKEKAAYFVLADDGVKRYDEFPEGFVDKIAEWKASQAKG